MVGAFLLAGRFGLLAVCLCEICYFDKWLVLFVFRLSSNVFISGYNV